jgi:hypothetical protein
MKREEQIIHEREEQIIHDMKLAAVIFGVLFFCT